MESMDITIEDSDTFARICRDVNLTPKKLFEDYIASSTLLHYTYEQMRNEGTERRSFEILSKLYQQIQRCTPSNLDIAPSLIEQTNKLVRINKSIGASIHDHLIDYDNHIVSYLDAVFERSKELKHQKNISLQESRNLMNSALSNVLNKDLKDTKKIKEVTKNTDTRDPSRERDSIFKYVDIGSIDNKAFRIIDHKIYTGKNAPSRARKIMKKDDILFATVRPYLKRIAKVPGEFDNEICSTSICVIRSSGELTPDYLII